ncbi:rhodanese-related sulfurtransferase [Neolewinella xylanilytica]|uniref:Rhodanese-related sulfurtransferase n=1 Tax=Neolewinella xylanilytica TaxID=1514080 RepID=A0A2S6I9P4_9BACT|nr:rhodanese-like domain-containing protein [Neolewinella xylanilytica]PPK88220.1 rhodanese-related sulfurtransferase [Neolewinella xylanilytica]
MTIQRFHDEINDQYSYLIIEQKEAIVVDPSRNAQRYLAYLNEHQLKLVGIALTHRPGSFASGWAELREKTRATVIGASSYRFHGEGHYLHAGRATMFPFGDGSHLQTQPTPGFTADSICLLAMDSDGKVQGIFTGGALLYDGVGYPLPRPEDKNPLHGRKTYVKEMYESLTKHISGFAPKANIYAGFGEAAHFSKMAESRHAQFNLTEAKEESPVLNQKDENAFERYVLADYPFVPAYVQGCLEKNPNGYQSWAKALYPFRELLTEEHRGEALKLPGDMAPASPQNLLLDGEEVLVIDTRHAADFTAGHQPGALNIQADGPFALALGSVVKPGEVFHVIIDEEEKTFGIAESIAKIGYDEQLQGASKWSDAHDTVLPKPLNLDDFKANHVGHYTIVDVRSPEAAEKDTRFYGAINIPYWELRGRAGQVPRDRPVVVHCGDGYASAIGASILRREIGDRVPVYDLGKRIKKFKAGR